MAAKSHGSPKRKIPAIEALVTAIFDNGRRGSPKPGCDCLQCFGYCIHDADTAAREMSLARETNKRGERSEGRDE
jgi:hypothetical protein